MCGICVGEKGQLFAGEKVLSFMGIGDNCASVVGVIEFSHVNLFRNQERACVCTHVCVFRWILNSVEKRPHKHPTTYIPRKSHFAFRDFRDTWIRIGDQPLKQPNPKRHID